MLDGWYDYNNDNDQNFIPAAAVAVSSMWQYSCSCMNSNPARCQVISAHSLHPCFSNFFAIF